MTITWFPLSSGLSTAKIHTGLATRKLQFQIQVWRRFPVSPSVHTLTILRYPIFTPVSRTVARDRNLSARNQLSSIITGTQRWWPPGPKPARNVSKRVELWPRLLAKEKSGEWLREPMKGGSSSGSDSPAEKVRVIFGGGLPANKSVMSTLGRKAFSKQRITRHAYSWTNSGA